MSPILNAETLNQLLEFQGKKFVRDGDVIAFDRPQMPHAVIADIYKLGKRVPGKRPLEDMGAVIVDDAGSIMSLGENLDVYDSSTTCDIRGIEAEQRQRTIEILRKITGKTIDAE